MFVVRNTNSATGNLNDNTDNMETVVSSISEMKLSAGSRVFREHSGQICRDWDTYRNGMVPYFNWSTDNSAVQEAYFPMPFGRFAGDMQCALPAPLYDSLDLYIKYKFETDAADGFTTGLGKYDLYIDILPEMSQEAYRNMRIIEMVKKQDFTTAASGVEPIDLTIDPTRQLRCLLVRCYEKAIAEGVDLTLMELEVDSEKKFTDDWNRWQYQNAVDCRLKYQQNMTFVPHADADVIWTGVPAVEPQITPLATGAEDQYLTVTADNITVTGVAADEGSILQLNSPVIPACIFMDFDKDLSLRNMLPMGVRDLVLKMTSGGAGGATEIHEQMVASP
ncbi:hypothetical protein KAT92_05970 [Candidatus Babeliales bacterium]|nr:hypothetical protein [Candidatus Babeliales bacterium]